MKIEFDKIETVVYDGFRHGEGEWQMKLFDDGMNKFLMGVLKPGAAADIIVMDYKPFTPFSDANIDGHMIFGMTGRQCQTTIGNGKVLMLDRQLVDVDEEAVNARILEESKKLWGALNNCQY